MPTVALTDTLTIPTDHVDKENPQSQGHRDMNLGLVCRSCSHLNSMTTSECDRCHSTLLPNANSPEQSHSPPLPSTENPPTAQPLDQNSSPEPPVSQEPETNQTLYFGEKTQHKVPRLVAIKGEEHDGVVFDLPHSTHTVGRNGCDISFTDDVFLSPKHAKFVVENRRLFVHDLDTANGVFVRIKQPTVLHHGELMLVGEQLMKSDTRPIPSPGPNSTGTHFYGSPASSGRFRLVQQLAGGGEGLVASSEGLSMTIGRTGNTLDFPYDRFISGHHAKLEFDEGTATLKLSDLGSRNGTFIRIRDSHELFHGDYLFVGQQLFRVEMG